MSTIAILRQLSAGHAALAAALRQAADEAEVNSTAAASEQATQAVTKGKSGPKKKAATEVAEADPLAGLTGAAEPAQEVEEDDPLAGLMGSGAEEPETPAVTRQDLAKLLGEMAGLVDGVKGKGSGSKALAALFAKHGSENLKTLAEDEFLGVKNEATAIIDAISKMKK